MRRGAGPCWACASPSMSGTTKTSKATEAQAAWCTPFSNFEMLKCSSSKFPHSKISISKISNLNLYRALFLKMAQNLDFNFLSMCFDIGSQHLGCYGQNASPEYRSLRHIVFAGTVGRRRTSAAHGPIILTPCPYDPITGTVGRRRTSSSSRPYHTNTMPL